MPHILELVRLLPDRNISIPRRGQPLGAFIVLSTLQHRTYTSTACVFVALSMCSFILASCADHGPDGTVDEATPASRFGMLVVTRTPSPVPGGATDDLRVNAFFVRHAGFQQTQVLDLMNLTDAPDQLLLGLEVGSCQVTERDLSSGIDTGMDSYVDLLDAGDVRLVLSGRGSARLRRRAFPDLFSNVGGVTYETSGIDGATVGTLQLAGRGSRQIGQFSVSLNTVPIPVLHSVGGQPVTSNYAAIDWREPLSLQWAPSQSTQTETYIELAALQYDRIVSLSCRASDTGLATLPRAGVEAVGELAQQDATVRLSVRRIAHQTFDATGVQDADAYYVARDSVFLK